MKGRVVQGLRGTSLQCVLGFATGLILLVSLFFAPGAWAGAISDQEELARFSEAGSDAGQLELPWGLATDPTTGHLYVVELANNNRISEFAPWGQFVKAFGWDVAPGAVNEQQEVRVRAAAGQFKLSFGGDTTGNLPFDAKAGEVEAALKALPSVGAEGVSVEAVLGTSAGTTPFIYVISFKGPLASSDVGQLTGTASLSGGVPTSSLVVRTRADGHAATAGLESCTAESGCQAGLEGNGAGQLAELARDVAVDVTGNIYVKEVKNHRVQKFDSAGRFLLAFGSEGTGPGQFVGFSGGIALCSGTLYVADKDRIQLFDLGGVFLGELPVPGEAVQRLACDPVGNYIYATFEGNSNVHRLDLSTGEEVSKIPVESLVPIATDSAGNLFAGSGSKLAEFDSSGQPLSPASCCDAAPFAPQGLATNSIGTVYAAYYVSGVTSFIRAFGPAPVNFELPPPVPPEITAQFASSVQRDGATVAAEINPHFFTDTHYYLQYGTGECSAGGCAEIPLSPPGPLLTTKASNLPVRTTAIPLEDLLPGTTYHYRFVAQSSGGGPVYGLDPDGDGPQEASAENGEEATFTTFPEPAPAKACPNDILRTGPAVRLPDCRAYEMVSPVDKNNGDIIALLDVPSWKTSLSQSATGGSKFTYTSYRSFGAPKGAPYANQYIATRTPRSGWSNEGIDPAQTTFFNSNSFENHFKAFSADLCQSWLFANAEPVLDPGVAANYIAPYRRDNCGGEGFEGLIPGEPPSKEALFPILQGTSASGKAALFMALDKLTDEAPSGVWQVYYASNHELHLVCVLPNGKPSGGDCSGGTSESPSGAPELERLASLSNSLSNDGKLAYWTETGSTAGEWGPGKVYLRMNPGEEQSAISGSGKCSETEKACTVKVSPDASRFLGASVDGNRALYDVTAGAAQGDLFKFELGSGSQKVAGETLGVAATSDDLARVYFISEEVLASGAIAKKANLYLDEEGTKSFVATISKEEASGLLVPSNGDPKPAYHAARATPDGRVLTFISTKSLTGYDSTDLVNGKADSEVYLYEVGATGPVCVSCNPSGGRPTGSLVTVGGGSAEQPTAAYLTLPENSLYSPRVLSDDGRRLFFNSFDALLPRDTNEKGDVYQWERASNQGGCEEMGGELYVAAASGCISLISTGESPQKSEFFDASADGGDAFFSTNTSLLPRDPGLIDVYDARVDGGIEEPTPPPPPCQGEACQPPVSAPNDPTPSSSSYVGPEDGTRKQKKAHKKKKAQHKKHKKKGRRKHKQGGRR